MCISTKGVVCLCHVSAAKSSPATWHLFSAPRSYTQTAPLSLSVQVLTCYSTPKNGLAMPILHYNNVVKRASVFWGFNLETVLLIMSQAESGVALG